MAPVLETIIVSILLAMILISVPVISYYTHVYYSHRTNPSIYKRHYDLVVVFNLLLILSLLCDKAAYMIAILATDNIVEAHKHTLYHISDYAYFFLGPSLLLFMSGRVWLVFYDLKWTLLSNPNNQWTHFVDPHYSDSDRNQSMDFILPLQFSHNWFIKHRSTLGNSRFFKKFVIVPSAIALIVLLCLSLLIHADIHYYIFCAFCALLALTVSGTYYLIPKMQIEIFKIKIEIDKLLKIGLGFLFCFVIYVVLRTFIVAEKHQFAVIVPFQYLFVIIYTAAALTSTRWVLIHSRILKRSNYTNLLTVLESDICSPSTDANDGETEQFWPLHKILRNKLSFTTFTQHLMKEFSSENILCILECYQFKEMISEMNESKASNDKSTEDSDASPIIEELELNKKLSDLRLPSMESMPRSAIVYGQEWSVEDRAHLLMHKYIFNNGQSLQFEVNISAGCKYRMINKLKDCEGSAWSMQEMYSLFDNVILELERLLNDSHLRFIRSEDYQKLILHDLV